MPQSNTKKLLIADPEILAIPINENGDQLIDIQALTTITYGPSPEVPNNTDYTKMRQSVYEKLVQAQSMLPSGLRFCLYEGYRSLQLQEQLFEGRYSYLRTLHPGWTHEQIFIEATRLVSPVINLDGSRNIPPHSTGAALDLYLIDEQGNAIDMGLHPKDWMEDSDGSLSVTDSTRISKTAQNNRDIMSQALSNAGFVNYPMEYWHWSFGDRYWAHGSGNVSALYGSL